MYALQSALAAAALLALAPSIALAEFDSKTNNTPGSFNASTVTRTVTFTAGDFTGTGIIEEVTIDLDITAGTFIGLEVWGEHSALLESPAGTVIQLFGDGEEFLSTAAAPPDRHQWSFDDGGGVISGEPVTGTSYDPEEALAAFVGESAIGTWTLSYGDEDVDDTDSTFHSFTLNLTTTAVPEPGTWALFAVGGLGLLGVARRRRKLAPSSST